MPQGGYGRWCRDGAVYSIDPVYYVAGMYHCMPQASHGRPVAVPATRASAERTRGVSPVESASLDSSWAMDVSTMPEGGLQVASAGRASTRPLSHASTQVRTYCAEPSTELARMHPWVLWRQVLVA